MLKFKETKEFYLLQKSTITLLVKTTTAGLQMVASSTKRSVVKVTRPARASTENFHFKGDIGIRPRAIIRPDTQLINSIGYTVTMSDYYFSALQLTCDFPRMIKNWLRKFTANTCKYFFLFDS